MKKHAPLLTQFESLPDLREKMESGSARARAVARREVRDLLAQESIVVAIKESMDDQRKLREKLSVTKDLREIADQTREAFIATKLRHMIPFFAMRAFSLPVDYRLPKESPWTKEMLHDFIDAIVIQPEYLSDEFLVSLGLMTEDEQQSLSLKEKIEKKIKLIPHIKELLHTLTPLHLGERKTTGRIARVSNPNHPNFGGYIVFQELPGMQGDTESSPRYMNRKIIPHYYRDHYSLMRSQSYAQRKLKARIGQLTELRDTHIPEILSRWQSNEYAREAKEADIAFLKLKLFGHLAFHEKKAIKFRIDKIDFKNPEHDRQRMIGATNDIIKGINDKLSKLHEIASQTEWLKDSEKQMRSAFELFYEVMMTQIPSLNLALDGVDPIHMAHEANLSGEQTHVLNPFLKTIERFHEHLSKLPGVGNPYHTLTGLIDNFLTIMRQHRSERKQAIGRAGIRLILSFILELKKIRYEVMLREVEHRQKIRGDSLSEREKKSLVMKVGRVRDSLENVRFLPGIELKEGGQRIFQEMIGVLDQISRSIGENSPL